MALRALCQVGYGLDVLSALGPLPESTLVELSVVKALPIPPAIQARGQPTCSLPRYSGCRDNAGGGHGACAASSQPQSSH
eukprot:14900550-Alexandrium_andersonii.AAC.1